MARSILSYLAIITLASLIATIALYSTSSSLKSLTDNPQQRKGDLSYQPPQSSSGLRHLNETTSAQQFDGHSNNGLEIIERRNLSEPPVLLNNSGVFNLIKAANNNNLAEKDKQSQQRVQQTSSITVEQTDTQQHPEPRQEPPNNPDGKRPSGVVYEYIPPPPINYTARSLYLTQQFPKLANLADDQNGKPTTALCGIVKDAEPYLDEWVDYHFGLGFHTIYLVDNSPHHELQSWQNKRREAGYSVRVLPKPGTHRQMYAYHMCAAEYRDWHTYMAFFDVDEYLVLKKHDTVTEMLVQHLEKGALAISWFIFGSGGKRTYGPLPVTKRFLYRDGLEEGSRHRQQWSNVKSVVKLSDYGNYPKSPHSMKTNKKTAGSESAWVDTSGKGNFDSIGAINYDRPVDVAVLHHYKYYSTKEFHWKACIRKTVDDKLKDCDQKWLRGVSPFEGTVYDDSAWETLKKNVPKYQMYDQFEDFM